MAILPENSANPYIAFRDRYAPDVERFIHEAFEFPNARERAEGKDIYPWQHQVNEWYNRRERYISVRSGHGVGKTTELAWLSWHHVLCRYPQKTAVTAPTEKQLFNAYWSEMQTWGMRLPQWLRDLVILKADRAELIAAPGASYISLATARKEQPEALAGVHSDYTLLIADEASGIPEVVFESASGSMSGHNAMTILTGNPVRGQGFFYDTHTKLQDMWKTLKVSSTDVAGVSGEFPMQVERTYGRNSNAYRVRVLGEFPVRDDDTVIPFELVEASFGRDIIIPRTAPVVWGVDPARFGSDRSVLAKRQTRQLMEGMKVWTKLDTMELAGRVKLEYDSTPQWLRPLEINVDAIGLGAGVVDRLRQLGLPARGINVSEAPAAVKAETYANLRAELWFKGLEWFNGRDVLLPDVYRNVKPGDDDLVGELTSVKYKFRPASGKIFVESKDDMRKRGMRSPDLADAFLLTLASDAITLASGSAAGSNWSRPISTNRRMMSGV